MPTTFGEDASLLARRALLPAILVAAALGLVPATAAAAHEPFALTGRYPAGDGVRVLAAADFDRDGDVDVLTADASGRLALHLGDGAGGLAGVTPLPGEAPGHTADLDADGLPDLLDVSEESGRLEARVRRADGRAGFGPVVESSLGRSRGDLRGVTTADADGDGRLDLVLRTRGPRPRAILRVAAGDGQGRFGRARRAGATRGDGPLVALPDLDADGRQELAVGGRGAVWISTSRESGGYRRGRPIRLGDPAAPTGPMVVARLASGDPALVVAAGGCIVTVPLTPWPAAVPPECPPEASPVAEMAGADFDGDGATDVVLTRVDGTVAVLYGRGAALGDEHRVVVPGAAFASSPLATDLDGDARPDLVLVADLRALALLCSTA